MSSTERQYTILIGGQKVGKTSIMNKLINNKFNSMVEPTFGPDLYRYSFNNKKLNILEIGGQEKCHHIVESYIKLANAFIIVYDITSYKSFITAYNWINYIRQQMPSNDETVIILVGNKVDSESDREVDVNFAQQLAKNYNLVFIETSALLGLNLNNIFKAISLPQSYDNCIN